MYLNAPGVEFARIHVETVSRLGSRSVERGMVTNSLPWKNRARPAPKRPSVQTGSYASTSQLLPSMPWFPLPDQSWTFWPWPSFMGHQPASGPPAKDAAGAARHTTAAAVATRSDRTVRL